MTIVDTDVLIDFLNGRAPTRVDDELAVNSTASAVPRLARVPQLPTSPSL